MFAVRCEAWQRRREDYTQVARTCTSCNTAVLALCGAPTATPVERREGGHEWTPARDEKRLGSNAAWHVDCRNVSDGDFPNSAR